VILNHVGLDGLTGIAELIREMPLGRPVRVFATRIPRDDIPGTDDERTAWLDRVWCEVDQWLDQQLSLSSAI